MINIGILLSKFWCMNNDIIIAECSTDNGILSLLNEPDDEDEENQEVETGIPNTYKKDHSILNN